MTMTIESRIRNTNHPQKTDDKQTKEFGKKDWIQESVDQLDAILVAVSQLSNHDKKLILLALEGIILQLFGVSSDNQPHTQFDVPHNIDRTQTQEAYAKLTTFQNVLAVAMFSVSPTTLANKINNRLNAAGFSN